ncbi:hypothetical protein [Kitasatospora aureofaciens]|uniref:hypothetical protein n=1 Tax=Kitasatospora aureofaciens TaxID=1894 RepID=UPI0036F48B90
MAAKTPADAPPTPVTDGIVGMAGAVPSTVRPQQYTSRVGWEVGDVAPADTYQRLDTVGVPYGDITHTHPSGHAQQITTAGCVITAWAREALTDGEFEPAVED